MKKWVKIGAGLAVIIVIASVGWKITRPDPNANPILADGGNSVTVLPFSELVSVKALPAGWQHRKFWFVPAMELTLDPDNPPATIRCETNAGGSIFSRSTNIDLSTYSTLVWDWRVDTPISSSIEEDTEAGDDHPARLFIVVQDSDDQSHAFEIIWSNQKFSPGAYKYIGDFGHYVANGRDENVGVWQRQSVNLLEVYKEIFGRDDAPVLTRIGIFCDSDNTGGKSDAYFSDVVLRR